MQIQVHDWRLSRFGLYNYSSPAIMIRARAACDVLAPFDQGLDLNALQGACLQWEFGLSNTVDFCRALLKGHAHVFIVIGLHSLKALLASSATSAYVHVSLPELHTTHELSSWDLEN